MFGIGLTEIIIIGIIALLVVGPEKLPELAAKIGRFAWDIRRAWDEVRDTVRAEMMTVKQPFDEIRQAGREAGDLVKRETKKMQDELRAVKTEAESSLKDTEASLKDAAKTEAEKEEKPEGGAKTGETQEDPATIASVAPPPDAQVEEPPQNSAAAEPVAAGPQPYRRKSPPPTNIVYYDLDGNPVEPPPEKV